MPYPYVVGYPVNFAPSGDTTSQAFYKHIQEIIKIYGLLEDLNSRKAEMSDIASSLSDMNGDLQSHIDSSSPHPNWNPTLSSLSGNLDVSRIDGD